ncbi:MAG TPA: PHB depolymerase family esterase, partial [Nonomuraea sp.]|nr:PHB depolymerase family esterase [Nonomuraea sp.]
YKVFVPPSYDGTPLPLLVDLHGCGSNADEEARWSRFNTLAAARRMLVAYPEQDPAANGSRCWNWFLPAHQSRDAGEPSIIAGITRAVMARWKADPRAVYLAGISAGGAMSDNMVATYPDLYAAAMVYAGCEYKGTTCTGGPAALPADVSGQLAYEAMGPRARVVPVMVIQGDLDPVVPAYNAELVVQQFLATDDRADDGVNNASISRTRSATRQGAKPGGESYEIDEYTDGARCLVARRWLVRGMLHQWSNAESNGTPRDVALTDPDGPDVSNPTLDFLLAYRMPTAGKTCSAALAAPPVAVTPAPAPAGPRTGGGPDGPPETLAVGGGSGANRVGLLALVGFVVLRMHRRRRPGLRRT